VLLSTDPKKGEEDEERGEGRTLLLCGAAAKDPQFKILFLIFDMQRFPFCMWMWMWMMLTAHSNIHNT